MVEATLADPDPRVVAVIDDLVAHLPVDPKSDARERVDMLVLRRAVVELHRLHNEQRALRLRVERAERNEYQARRDNGSLRVQAARALDQAREIEDAARLTAHERGITDDEITMTVDHYRNLERCHAATEKHLRGSLAKLQAELRAPTPSTAAARSSR